MNKYGNGPKYNYACTAWRKLSRFAVVNKYSWALDSKGTQTIRPWKCLLPTSLPRPPLTAEIQPFIRNVAGGLQCSANAGPKAYSCGSISQVQS